MDVLFFGLMNPRRAALLAAVNASGLAVHVLTGETMTFGGGPGRHPGADQDCSQPALLRRHHGATTYPASLSRGHAAGVVSGRRMP